MSFNKKFFTTGGIVASAPPAAAAFDPLQNFETVTYTGNGSTQKITGYIRKGAAFNGSSSYIENTDTSIWGATWTISLWFKTSNNSGRSPLFVFGRGNYTDGIELQSASANTVSGSYAEGSKYFSKNVSVNLDDNNWHHYCTTYDSSSDTIKLYIDGNEETGLTTGTGNSRQGSGYRIGRFFQTPEQWATGSIDQVRIFDKALSSNEVTTLHNETYDSSTKSTTDIFGDSSGIALYELDEDANDTGGVSGKFGSAAIFNGSSSYITLGTGVVPVSSDCSITMWVYRNTGSGRDVLLSQFQSSQDNRISIEVDDTTNKISFNGDDVTLRTSTYTVPFDEWVHLAFTLANATDDFKVYANGIEQTTQIDSGSADYTFKNYPTQLGTYNSISDSRVLDGKIDELRIYSDVLTSNEVGYIYNNTTASIPTDNLENYYKFDGDATDEQGNNNATTVNNISYGYNGTPTNINFLGMAFQPDLVWVKDRDTTNYEHVIFDSVRGTGTSHILSSDLTSQEGWSTNGSLTSFDSNGFTLPNTVLNNANGHNYVAWCWKAGGAAVSGSGTNVSSVTQSENAAAGFGIYRFTTTSSDNTNITINHNLNATPEMVIAKETSGTDQWYVYHSTLGTNKYLLFTSNAATTVSSAWGAGMTSSVIGARTAQSVDSGETHVAYAFHSVDGYQKVGSYTGNRPTDVVIDTGFAPRFVMIKCDASGESWTILDSARGDNLLHPDTSGAEQSYTGVSLTSTGFTVHDSGLSNTNGATHIYLAIA